MDYRGLALANYEVAATSVSAPPPRMLALKRVTALGIGMPWHLPSLRILKACARYLGRLLTSTLTTPTNSYRLL